MKRLTIKKNKLNKKDKQAKIIQNLKTILFEKIRDQNQT